MISGCVPVLVTPLNENREVDYAAYDRIMPCLKKQGVSCLWVLGTGGEDMALPFKDRLNIVRYLTEKYSTEFEMLVGCSFFSFSETLAFLREIEKLDIAGVHYMPYQPLIGLEQLYENYLSVADLTSFPVWIYTSANWTRHIPPSFVGRFSHDARFAGCKYSTSNIVDMEEALSYQSDRFQILPAVVKQLLPSLALGATAFTTVEAMVHLDRINRIVSAFAENDIEGARVEQRNLNALLTQLSMTASRQNFLKTAEIKGIMWQEGLCERWVSAGLMDISEEEARKLYRAYRQK